MVDLAESTTDPVQRFFAQASLPCEFLEGYFSMDQIAQHGKALSGLTFNNRTDRFCEKRPREFGVSLNARDDSLSVISC